MKSNEDKNLLELEDMREQMQMCNPSGKRFSGVALNVQQWETSASLFYTT